MEVRGFMAVHHAYEDAVSPKAHKDALDQVKRMPYYTEYCEQLARRAMRIKAREAE